MEENIPGIFIVLKSSGSSGNKRVGHSQSRWHLIGQRFVHTPESRMSHHFLFFLFFSKEKNYIKINQCLGAQ